MISAPLKMFLNPLRHDFMVEVTMFLKSGFGEQIKHHRFQGSTKPMFHGNTKTLLWLFKHETRNQVFDCFTQNGFCAPSM
jgi:hypothetical protein